MKWYSNAEINPQEWLLILHPDLLFTPYLVVHGFGIVHSLIGMSAAVLSLNSMDAVM